MVKIIAVKNLHNEEQMTPEEEEYLKEIEKLEKENAKRFFKASKELWRIMS